MVIYPLKIADFPMKNGDLPIDMAIYSWFSHEKWWFSHKKWWFPNVFCLFSGSKAPFFLGMPRRSPRSDASNISAFSQRSASSGSVYFRNGMDDSTSKNQQKSSKKSSKIIKNQQRSSKIYFRNGSHLCFGWCFEIMEFLVVALFCAFSIAWKQGWMH